MSNRSNGEVRKFVGLVSQYYPGDRCCVGAKGSCASAIWGMNGEGAEGEGHVRMIFYRLNHFANIPI
jgi:hypothetical protein